MSSYMMLPVDRISVSEIVVIFAFSSFISFLDVNVVLSLWDAWLLNGDFSRAELSG